MALSLFGNSIMTDPFFGSYLGWNLPLQGKIFGNLGTFDIGESDKEYSVKMDTPGLGVDDIKVEIEDTNILTISGERNCEVEHDESDYYERIYGKFSRSYRLLDNSDIDNLRATINRGVLSVTIPKRDPDPPSIRQIQIENTDEDTSDH